MRFAVLGAAVAAAAEGDWTEVAPASAWGERAGHAVVATNASLFLLGGSKSDASDGSESDQDDVWVSSNGLNWTSVTAAADWTARSYHRVLHVNDSLFLLGGFQEAETADDDDVWSSSDGGESWTLLASAAPWAPRDSHAALAFDGRLWVLGGSGTTFFKDTWVSADGAAWSVVDRTTSAWSSRHSHAAVVHGGAMYLLGGLDEFGFTNDVWRSFDGGAWEVMTAAAEWSRRSNFDAASFEDRLYLFGGNNAGVFRSDLWFSEDDGATWIEAYAPDEMRSRAGHAMVGWEGSLWVIGGRVACGEEDGRDQAGADAENRCYIGDVWRGDGQGLAATAAADDVGITLALALVGMAGALLVAMAAAWLWRRRRGRQRQRPKGSQRLEMTSTRPRQSTTSGVSMESLAAYISERAEARLAQMASEEAKGPEGAEEDGTAAGRKTEALSLKRHLLAMDEFDIQEIVGKGSYGVVRRAQWRGMDVAMKTVHDAPLDDVVLECEIMATVGSHRNVVQFLGLTCCPTLGLSLITEFMHNGSLEDLIYLSNPRCKRQELKLYVLVRMATDAAMGVAHLHHEGVIHRDLACRNLLVDEHMTVAVADFGFARVKNAARDKGFTQNRIGPIKWEAPEAFTDDRKEYSEKTDVWSFGVCLYEIATGQAPWTGFSDIDAAVAVIAGQQMEIPEEVDPVFAGIMRDCWSREPALRPDMRDVHKRLNLYYSAVAPPLEVKRPRKERSFRQPETSNYEPFLADDVGLV